MGFGFYVERDILSAPSSNGHPSGRMMEMMNSGALDLRTGVKKGHVKDGTSAVGYEEPKQVIDIHSSHLNEEINQSYNFNTGQEVGNHVAGRRTLEDKLQYKSHTSNEHKCQCCPYTCTLGTLHLGNKMEFGNYVEARYLPCPSFFGHPLGRMMEMVNTGPLDLRTRVQKGHEKEEYKEMEPYIGQGEGHQGHKQVVDTHPSGFSEHKESPNSSTGQKRLKRKRKWHSPEEYKCGECLYTCIVEAAMKKHVLERDHSRLKHSCPICGEDQLDEDSVKEHVEKHHRQENQYTCNFKTDDLKTCDFKTSRLRQAVFHRRTHTGEKPHRCPSPNCLYRANRRDTMCIHVGRMHNSRNSQEDTFDPKSWMANYSRRIAL